MEYKPIYYEGCKFLSEQRKTCNKCNARETCIACYDLNLTDRGKDMVMSYEEFIKPPEKEPLVPRRKVLDDMYNPNGGIVAHAARDYYYENYATDEEKAEMDREDKRFDTILKVVVGIFVFMMAITCIRLMF